MVRLIHSFVELSEKVHSLAKTFGRVSGFKRRLIFEYKFTECNLKLNFKLKL